MRTMSSTIYDLSTILDIVCAIGYNYTILIDKPQGTTGDEMKNRTAHYMTMEQSKINEIVKKMGAAYDEDSIVDALLGDWPNAEEHQEWLTSATTAEIVDWLESFMEEKEEN